MGNDSESPSPDEVEQSGAVAHRPGDGVYRALDSTRRRRILFVLLDKRTMTVESLATVLAGWDATETGTMTTPTGRDKIVVELEHIDLPMLAEAGLVSYDPENGQVSTGRVGDGLRHLVAESVASDETA